MMQWRSSPCPWCCLSWWKERGSQTLRLYVHSQPSSLSRRYPWCARFAKQVPRSQKPNNVAEERGIKAVEEDHGVVVVANKGFTQVWLHLLNAGVRLAVAGKINQVEVSRLLHCGCRFRTPILEALGVSWKGVRNFVFNVPWLLCPLHALLTAEHSWRTISHWKGRKKSHVIRTEGWSWGIHVGWHLTAVLWVYFL